MRLTVTESGHALPNRMFLKMLKWSTGAEPVDVLRTLHYRTDFWGRPYSTLLQDVMRGPSEWSPGERELFAAFTARVGDCAF